MHTKIVTSKEHLFILKGIILWARAHKANSDNDFYVELRIDGQQSLFIQTESFEESVKVVNELHLGE